MIQRPCIDASSAASHPPHCGMDPADPLAFLHAPTAVAPPGADAPDEEAQMVVASVRDFVDREVLPANADLERGDTETLKRLLASAAELGLTGLELPERFGGLGLKLTPALRVMAELSRQPSFSTSLAAHFCIGSLPLALFGSETLKARWLPTLASGERIGAYALTEPSAGSDALGVRARAERADGGFVLHGQKQFVTNGGIAGLYTVFAKVDGALTAFLVPAETPGLVPGRPEHKLGLRGSPTTPVALDGVHVPEEQVIGRVGGGHRVAFDILTLGRLSLGWGSLGVARAILTEAAAYAAERQQFGRPIGEFGLVRTKLATMAARTQLLEGFCLRVARDVDARAPDGLPESAPGPQRMALRHASVPSAMVKVFGAEAAGLVADEGVQIHGGYGFVEEYPVCGLYRDVRINRIYEGTSEVNRVVVAGGLVKRQLTMGLPDDGPLTGEPGAEALCNDLRGVLGRLMRRAVDARGAEVVEHAQTAMAALADVAMELGALDTALSRGLCGALLTVATETVRTRCITATTRAATQLAPDEASQLASTLVAGARDVSDAEAEVAASL